MLEGLRRLAREFDRIAMPRRGRYVGRPAIADESGVVDIPPPVQNPLPKVAAGLGVAILAGALLRRAARTR
jgi:hypothetical protein